MTDDRKIRDRAYAIWQREGGGDHERHRHQAEMEIAAIEQAARSLKARKGAKS